ncbi:hypothetical protein CP02DC21_1125, partial [Chlamydia psittaci 02DC21]
RPAETSFDRLKQVFDWMRPDRTESDGPRPAKIESHRTRPAQTA